ncbi:hypothetical protein FEM33_08560 [Dyadobacter flavalbus]|uniref:Outer membrane beta-barrel protein n=1 Tax=Dyadobacter flavalbus TaxID=2579942 RepID=A0A5M8QYX7_9BACT|nr:hypothetical protein [Dyadobacter flavalbus]KAA6440621.1 hypothetical protein FEM33_08560 [Dyadobacter flavalbus]
MKKTVYLLALSFCFSISAAYAQLTIFNVSSSEITDKHKASVQQQFEFQDIINSTTTVTYGLGKFWEAGFNVVNVDYDKSLHHFTKNDTSTVDPYAPLLMVNSQKLFKLNEVLGIGIGGLAGSNFSGKKHFVYYSYANLAASLYDEHYKLAAGAYLGNRGYLGEGPIDGVQLGLDAGIWYEKIHILADWLSGAHPKGQLSAGLGIYFLKHLPVSVGWQHANADGSNGWVLQVTYVP